MLGLKAQYQLSPRCQRHKIGIFKVSVPEICLNVNKVELAFCVLTSHRIRLQFRQNFRSLGRQLFYLIIYTSQSVVYRIAQYIMQFIISSQFMEPVQ